MTDDTFFVFMLTGRIPFAIVLMSHNAKPRLT